MQTPRLVPRRLVRIKVLQNFYAYTICKQASQQAAAEAIEQAFAYDVFLDAPHKKPFLEQEKKAALELFWKTVVEEASCVVQAPQTALEQLVGTHVARFREEVQQDQRMLQGRFQQAKRNIYKVFLHVWALLVAWHKMAQQEDPEALARADAPLVGPLSASPLLQTLLQSDAWHSAVRMQAMHWSEEQIRDGYLRLLKTAPPTARSLDDLGPERHLQLLEYMVQNLIFKDPQIGDFFFMMDVYWDEHKKAIRKLLRHSFAVLQAGGASAFEGALLEFDRQWEHEEGFYNRLFEAAIQKDAAYELLIGEKAEKWSQDRMVLIDKLLIKLALVEMSEMQEIPTKVSMNEYIELARLYGTPKSSQFVNGLLEGALPGLERAAEARKEAIRGC